MQADVCKPDLAEQRPEPPPGTTPIGVEYQPPQFGRPAPIFTQLKCCLNLTRLEIMAVMLSSADAKEEPGFVGRTLACHEARRADDSPAQRLLQHKHVHRSRIACLSCKTGL